MISLLVLAAFLSGVVFAGVLGQALLTTMRRSGVVKDQQPEALPGKVRGVLFLSTLLLAVMVFGYLKTTRSETGSVTISGAVSEPYEFSPIVQTVTEQTVKVDRGGISASYRGYPLLEILEKAQPESSFDIILVRASDGYAFFITADELEKNRALLLQPQGQGDKVIYNLIGPRSMKAWINGVVEISLISADPLELQAPDRKWTFDPGDWIQEMDSTALNVGSGKKKYQGVPLSLLFADLLQEGTFEEFMISGHNGEEIALPVENVMEDTGIRVFIILDESSISYAAAHLNGDIYLPSVQRIYLQ